MNREAVNPVAYVPDAERGDVVRSRWGLHPCGLLAVVVSIPVVATFFWWLGTTYFESTLELLAYQQLAVLIAAVTAGGYQLYFWVQRNTRATPARCLVLPFDARIGFEPRWIWFYSVVHYAMVGLTVITIQDAGNALSLVFGGLMVLVSGCAIFYFFPTDVPESYRSFEITSLSTRYLSFIQSMDNSRNAFPSMHCAIATYAGATLATAPSIGPWLGYGFITATVVSCLWLKQHVVLDTVGGVALGLAVFHLNGWLAASVA